MKEDNNSKFKKAEINKKSMYSNILEGIPLSGACTKALWKRYQEGIIPVIPDIKRKSPKEGELLGVRDPINYAKALVDAGAPIISVVTEKEHYGGSLEMLSMIAEAVSVPVLRKDFINTREQLVDSLRSGAGSVLLMASIMETEQLLKLITQAYDLGMEPLVEIHTKKQLDALKACPLTFLGINNRNILEWEIDDGNVETTKRIAGNIKSKGFVLSESSISNTEEVLTAVKAGAHGVLVGTAILKAADPVEMFHKLSIQRQKT
ncbi:indole-3-glycerol-phosphate synthase [Mobilitalea sibirica]|uniref:indole-3-glycerol-phosphate synthase n=1 Tax=Mobilitalea sibirica TaxID=1462919 RepID=A0A8J7HBC1_9FIRM|nr:indole-3-glycerol-phosphate synthase [Mobilitalea sibirica]MBH1941750.1 indole-3-glycerol-phosphate synthase [Mobilitalea sibirica]